MADAETSWYDALRNANRPEGLRILLIGESPPDHGAGDRRFFYSPTLSQHDNLYRGVAVAFYGLVSDFDLKNKRANLERLRRDGVWLIDAVDTPINKRTDAARRQAITAGADDLAARCLELAPSVGVILCHTPVFKFAGPTLGSCGVRVLHDEPIPFPLGNVRARFVESVREAIARASGENRASCSRS